MTQFDIAMGRAHFEEYEKDAGYCQYFVEYLNGSALNWVSCLEENSIENFNQIPTAFVKHYSMFMEKGASTANMWTLSQLPTEPLRGSLKGSKQ